MLSIRSLTLRTVAVAAVVVVTAGASSCETDVTEPRFVADLVLRNPAGDVRDVFLRDEAITLELKVRNRGSSEAVLQFSSTQQYDFVVVDAGTSRVRWKWSTGKAFAQRLTELTFAPGETKTFTVTWDQLDAAGQPVGAGSYEARGVLLFEEFAANPLASHQLGSPLKAFRIN